MTPTTDQPGLEAASGVASKLALWFGLGVAFSPVIVDWVEDWPDIFAAGSLLLPIAMLVRLASVPRAVPAAWGRPVGVALVAGGVALELLGITVGAWSIARFGPAVAIMGVLLWAHRWPARAAVIALGGVPIPAFAYVVTTPTVEVAYGVAATALLGWIGVVVPISGPLVGGGAAVLELQPAYNGLHSSWLLALIGWYRGVRLDAPIGHTIRHALVGAALGPLVQLAAIVFAVGLVAIGAAGVARLWLEQGLWIWLAVAGFSWVEISSRRAGAEPTRIEGERA